MSTQGDGMAEVTEGDRHRSALIVGSMSDEVLGRLLKGDIAAALAEEREKAREPFLAILAERDRLDTYMSDGEFSRRIRRAAEVTE